VFRDRKKRGDPLSLELVSLKSTRSGVDYLLAPTALAGIVVIGRLENLVDIEFVTALRVDDLQSILQALGLDM
jgi:hypothetical protein